MPPAGAQPHDDDGPAPDVVLRQLDHILAWESFAASKRLSAFLRFVVEHTLSGDAAALKEYRIGAEVYERGPGFDARVDSIVRVEANRLRAKLQDYYRGPGSEDAVRIEIPKGTYTPVFRTKAAAPSTVPRLHWPRAWTRTALIAAAVLVVVVLYAAAMRYGPASSSARAAVSPSVAVLPFVDLSPNRDRGYLCDGITAELINRLSRLPNLRVVARTSVFTFKDKPYDARQIGDRLNVSTILEGSVLQDGSRLRVEVELISAADGYQLWSERYERTSADVMLVEDEIAGRITRALGGNLATGAGQFLAKRPATTPQAYDLYLRGRQAWESRGEGDLRRSIQYYEAALKEDPNLALAWAGLADSYEVMISNDIVPALQFAPRARDAALKAIGLDPAMAEPHATLGLILPVFDWQWEEAERQFQRAIALQPGYATAHQWYGLHLMCRGRFEAAERELRTALQLDPLSRMIRYSMGDVFFYSRRYDKAIEQYQRLADLDPAWGGAHQKMGLAYDLERRPDKAAVELQTMLSSDPDAPYPYVFLEPIYGELGRQAEANQMNRNFQERFSGRSFSPRMEAIFDARRGQREAALQDVEEIYERHEAVEPTFKVDPWLDNVRYESRFVAVLHKTHLDR